MYKYDGSASQMVKQSLDAADGKKSREMVAMSHDDDEEEDF